MTDIAATLDLAALDEYDETISLHRHLFAGYEKGLAQVNGVRMICNAN